MNKHSHHQHHSDLGESHLDRFFYPVWLRIWHWTNAFFFFVLIATGVSMHFSSLQHPVIPFETARFFHNTAGILLSINYLYFVIANFISGNYKQYIPVWKNLIARLYVQARYYLYDMFRGKDHPFRISHKRKFNPLQQLAYVLVMYYMMPLAIISGLMLFFPEAAPEQVLGAGGIWPIAVFHITLSYLLTFFMFVHVYLATHGETLTENFHGMITGYHVGEIDKEHGHEKKEGEHHG